MAVGLSVQPIPALPPLLIIMVTSVKRHQWIDLQYLRGEFPAMQGDTLYTRLSDWPVLIFSFLLLVLGWILSST